MFPFREWLKLKNDIVEFSFKKIQAPGFNKFVVTGLDADRNNVSFNIIQSQDGKWSIVQQVPESIYQIKEELVNVIKGHS